MQPSTEMIRALRGLEMGGPMSLFDRLTEQALRSSAALGMVRPAVEKELLHHDILREMGRAGLLAGLTFIGGTCLRTCYGS